MKKNFVKYFFKILASILLMIFLTVSVFASSVYLSLAPTLKGADGYIAVAQKADKDGTFFDEIYANAVSCLENRGTLGGFPKELFDGLITREYTVRVFNEFLESAAKGEVNSFRLNELEDKLRVLFTEYAESGAFDEKITEEEIEDFIDYLDEELVNAIKLPFFLNVYPYIEIIYSPAMITGVIIGVFVVCLACFGLFFLLWRKTITALRNTMYSLMGGGFMTIALSLFLGALNGKDYFTFSTPTVLSYLTAMQGRIVAILNITGCVIAVIGTSVCLCIMYFSKERNADNPQ